MTVDGAGGQVVEILGVPVARLDPDAALAAITRCYDLAAPALVAYANAHTLNLAARDPGYRAVLRRAALVLNDGAGLALAGRLRGRPFPANLNGSDFTPRVLALAAARGWPVYFLGARPGVAEEAARRLRARMPDLRVVGVRDGYFPPEETAAVVEAVRRSRTGLLLVAMGNPRQEFWLDQHLAATGARVGIGVGAFFDFAAGVVPRAPAWMNRVGVEWVYRLAHEPRRLWRRYLVGNGVFLARVTREALLGIFSRE
ncbi:MAG: WecB/TagA/CpsF family glycosyltransferase [Armatimonadota bacterium]|nr:WecB/TagA/CpsF family glycosyltransferase [Armatimonadota bacterium]MDR7496646.1 WecB/TagA/CpsF family glycosyltransferase [Armatimonadota bacterium]